MRTAPHSWKTRGHTVPSAQWSCAYQLPDTASQTVEDDAYIPVPFGAPGVERTSSCTRASAAKGKPVGASLVQRMASHNASIQGAIPIAVVAEATLLAGAIDGVEQLGTHVELLLFAHKVTQTILDYARIIAAQGARAYGSALVFRPQREAHATAAGGGCLFVWSTRPLLLTKLAESGVCAVCRGHVRC